MRKQASGYGQACFNFSESVGVLEYEKKAMVKGNLSAFLFLTLEVFDGFS
jgi:hypothetical protein